MFDLEDLIAEIPPSMPQHARHPGLQGRPVLITGGATGVGPVLAGQLLAQGVRVGFTDIARIARAFIVDGSWA